MELARELLTQTELERFGIAAGADGVRPDPFDTDSPEDIWTGGSVKALDGVLWDAVKRKHILCVVGEPGAGKTTLIRKAYGAARRQKQIAFVSPGTLDRRKVTHKTLAVSILRGLIGKDTSNLSQEVRDDLLRTTLGTMRGLHPVLLVDEAHLLPNAALLAIKHVWDSHTLFKQLAVVLAGQPLLASRMSADAEIREFTMRARIVEVPALTAEGVGSYLEWHFQRVGVAARDIFAPGVYDVLARRGRVPLQINALTVRAMRLAAPAGRRVEVEHAGRA